MSYYIWHWFIGCTFEILVDVAMVVSYTHWLSSSEFNLVVLIAIHSCDLFLLYGIHVACICVYGKLITIYSILYNWIDACSTLIRTVYWYWQRGDSKFLNIDADHNEDSLIHNVWALKGSLHNLLN